MEEETILNAQQETETAVVQEKTVTPDGQPAEKPENSGAVFDYGKMIGTEGGLAENWREGLPESIRNEKCLDSIKTIGTLAQSYVHAQRSIGAGKVAIPGENATPEEWSAFYKACGRPDTAEGYKHDKVKLPDGVTLDEAQLSGFRKFAFENGMSQKAYEAALAFDVQRAQQTAQAQQAAKNAEYDDTLGKLRTEYGAEMETVVAQCNKAIQTFGLAEVLSENGLLNNYTIIKALAGIGKKISESRLKDSDVPVSGFDPQSRLNEIKGNPDDAFYRKDHPSHAARVAEVNGLLAAIAKMKK